MKTRSSSLITFIPPNSKRITPRVSVVMPIYNVERYLAQAIESVLRQSFEDFELLLLDDGSSDRSAKIAQQFADQDQRIVFVKGDHHGVVFWRNFGCQAATGELIAVMDADDISAPERFEIQVAFLNARPECCLVGTQALRIDSDGLPISAWRVPQRHGDIEDGLMRGLGGSMINPSVMMRKDAVHQIGGYRRGFDAAEDYDLFLRLATSGQLANLPLELLQYRLHSKSLTFAQAENQAASARRALEEAWVRRNNSGPVPAPLCRHKFRSEDELTWDWACAAFNARHYRTSRKHGFRLLRNHPLEMRRWIIFAASCLGPMALFLMRVFPYRVGRI